MALGTRIGALLRSPFAFLFARSSHEDRIAAYAIREYTRGRSLDDILDDPYVVNRCSPREIARVLERPEVIKVIGDDLAEEAKRALETLNQPSS